MSQIEMGKCITCTEVVKGAPCPFFSSPYRVGGWLFFSLSKRHKELAKILIICIRIPIFKAVFDWPTVSHVKQHKLVDYICIFVCIQERKIMIMMMIMWIWSETLCGAHLLCINVIQSWSFVFKFFAWTMQSLSLSLSQNNDTSTQQKKKNNDTSGI